ncbi:MAG TPA: glycosyltransferase, partial [Gemmatimonadales bacterium]|nr:glycosyltransferase [Gemmatimonadales bacterium]
MRATVSVVIPSYNSAAYLPGALASVRAQRRAADEIVVVDDGSSDDSRAIALEAGARVIQTGTNAGPAAARNLGIA